MPSLADTERLLASLPASTQDLLDLARALEHQERHAESVALLRRALARHPDSAFHIALGAQYMKQRHHKDALVHLVEVLRQTPDHHPTILLVTECLIECGELDRAQHMLTQAQRAGAPSPRQEILRQRLLTKRREGQRAQGPDPLAPSHSALMPNPLEETLDLDAPTKALERPSALGGALAMELPQAYLPAQTPAQIPAQTPAQAPRQALSPPRELTLEQTLDERADDWPAAGHGFDDHEDGPTLLSDLPDFGQLSAQPALRPLAQGPPQASPQAPPQAPEGLSMPSVEDQEPTRHFESPYKRPTPASLASEEPTSSFEASPRQPPPHALPADMVDGPDQGALMAPSPSDWLLDHRDHGPQDELHDHQDAPRVSEDDLWAIRAQHFGLGPAAGAPQAAHPPHAHPPQALPSSAPTARSTAARARPEPVDVRADVRADMPPKTAPKAAPPRQAPARDREHEPGLELELDLDRPDPSPRARQAAPTRITASGSPREERDALGGVKRRLIHRVSTALPVLAVLLVLALYATVYVADRSVASRIEADVLTARRGLEQDRMQTYVASLAALERALTHASFLGAERDAMIARKLPSLPGLTAQQLRRQALGLLARHAARAEHRFSALGQLRSPEHIERAGQALGHDHADVLVGRLYQELPLNPLLCVTLAQGASLKHPQDMDLVAAHVEALAQLGHHERAWAQAEALRKLGAPSAHQRLIAALASEGVGKVDEARHLVEQMAAAGHSEHPDAQALLASLPHARRPSTLKERVSALGAILELRADELGPAQRARHLARLGRMELERGELDLAILAHKKAAQSAPSRHDLQLGLLDMHLLRGDYEEAQRQLQEASRAAQASPLVTLRQARQLLEPLRGSWALARLELARLAAQAHDWSSAAAAAQEAAQLDGARGEAGALRLLALQMSQPEQAQAHHEALLAGLPGGPHQEAAPLRWAAASHLERARANPKPNPKDKARKEHLAQAQALLERASALAPVSLELERAQCELLRELGEPKAALARCARAAELAPQHPQVLMALAAQHLSLGQALQARDLLTRYTSEHPTHWPSSLMLARALTRAGRLDAAQAELDRWLSDPVAERAEFKAAQGMVAFARGQLDVALGYLKQAAQLDPQHVEAQIYWAYTRVRFGELKEPEQTLREHLEHPQLGGVAWLALGELRRRQRRFKDAEQNLERAISALKASAAGADGAISEAYMQRALAWQDKHGWAHPRVEAHLKAALAQGGQDLVEVHYLLGLRELNQRRPDLARALTHLERAHQLSPEHCMTLRSLDYLYKKLNRASALQDNAAKLRASCPS